MMRRVACCYSEFNSEFSKGCFGSTFPTQCHSSGCKKYLFQYNDISMSQCHRILKHADFCQTSCPFPKVSGLVRETY